MMTTQPRESVSTRFDTPVWRQVLDTLDPFAEWMFRLSVAAAGLSLAYILLSIFGGHIGQLAPGAPGLRQVISRVTLASQLLSWAAILMALSIIILAFDIKSFGPAIAVAGLAFHFGVPLLLFSSVVGRSPVTLKMVPLFQNAGFILVVLGLCKYAVDGALWVATLPDRMKQKMDVGVGQMAEPAQQRIARHATMFSPCWQLPFCREAIRKQCPAYLAKKRCWKFGRGCYCDEEMISRIIRGESIDVVKAPTRQSRQGKPPCGRCYIYLEHQTLKFRSLGWLAIPGTIIAMFSIWPFYTLAFQTLSTHLDSLINGLSFNPRQLTPDILKAEHPAPDIGQLSPAQVTYFAQILFGVILGFLLLTYISRFIEWAIFKAKL